jgi:hypothetical protein
MGAILGGCSPKLSTQLHLNDNITIGVDIDLSKREHQKAVQATIAAAAQRERYDAESQLRIDQNLATLGAALCNKNVSNSK